ncbi:hypothetical protein KIW84_043972 [Lathyrus oleraceus]|uniref:Uncharacterized protein n=1 Tax=Pisum sativum TaxID=3888 RepID=A0A9D4XIZ6_PEA|nr:hypothetical protein KIW84_043972 [Pisum sativum]
MEDALATLASMIIVKYWNEVPNLSVMSLDRPTHVFAVEEIKDEKLWYWDIKCFLQSQIYPPGASLKDKKTLRRLSGNFYLNGDILYKRNFDMVLLRCVDRHEANLLMTEVHEGSFGIIPMDMQWQRRCCEKKRNGMAQNQWTPGELNSKIVEIQAQIQLKFSDEHIKDDSLRKKLGGIFITGYWVRIALLGKTVENRIYNYQLLGRRPWVRVSVIDYDEHIKDKLDREENPSSIKLNISRIDLPGDVKEDTRHRLR